MQVKVKKRNGKMEPFNAEKVHKVINWAVENVNGVNPSDIEINAHLESKPEITAREIHEALVDSAANLISEKTPNYQVVAAKLLNYQLRKDVWGGKNPPKLYDFIKKNVEETKVYDPDILTKYSKQEINKLDEFIDHERDFFYQYAGIRQLCDKYLVQNRLTGEIYETPQFAYMLVAMTLFSSYHKDIRVNYVKRAYDFFAKKINLPTPLMAGVRTKIRQYSSCCLIDVGDSMKSIASSQTAVNYATASRFGIGLNMGRIRALNAPIRDGDVIHTGPIPFLKAFESIVKSCHQNGIRGGSATVNFPFWHYNIEDIVVLKNNAGTDDNRVRKLDYTIQFSKIFYLRYLENKDITLFSPHEVPDLYSAFGHPEFDELYEKYEKDINIQFKKKISADSLMSLITKERVETGRIYIMNIDHVNHHGSWLDDVKMQNLCLEVTHPTVPLQHIDDPNGEIGVCVLSAINLLEIQSWADLEKVCEIVIRMLDEVIEHQVYFNIAAEKFAKERRSLGVGITNLAALLAKNDLKYEDEKAPNLVDEWMERIQYYLLSASVRLAKEKGRCVKFDRTKYSKGILPIDTYNKNLDEVVTRKLSMDWESLRRDILEHGLRHSTVTALMPCESSAVIQCSTNGVEPVRATITYKKSKTGTLPVLVPHFSHWKNKYTLAFDMKSNRGLININAALQKYVDMAISTNLYYDYNHYENGILPDEVVVSDMIYAYQMGLKAIYYTNTNDDIESKIVKEEKSDGCESGACAI